MALMITDDCIECKACFEECPNNAIIVGDDLISKIDPYLCTECVGYYSEPQCVDVCPIDAVKQNPDFIESRDQLLLKKERISAASLCKKL
jgi:ferredoxin